MDDARSLFREGVLALREQNDTATARRLISQSLKLDPQNEMAWLWLSRTTNDPEKRLACAERALRINPDNEQAQALKAHLSANGNGSRPAVAAPAAGTATAAASVASPGPAAPADNRPALTIRQRREIHTLMAAAEKRLAAEDVEGAIENWVRVLEIQVDHPEAMRLAVRHLSRLKYIDDARELLYRAIDAGTTDPGIYLTAIDIARVQGEYAEMDNLGELLARLPEAGDAAILVVIDRMIKENQPMRAMGVIDIALTTHPDSQGLMTRKADLYSLMEQEVDARHWYDQAARRGAGTQAGREADKKLSAFTPVLSDRERGSTLLAVREALGFTVFFVLLAWQDAGLNLLAIGPQRLLGIIAGTLGGYLLVSATSSAQQQPLARWLGGAVPPAEDEATASAIPILPHAYRTIFATAGAVLVIVAFVLVFGTALSLVLHPAPPPDLPTFDEIFYGV